MHIQHLVQCISHNNLSINEYQDVTRKLSSLSRLDKCSYKSTFLFCKARYVSKARVLPVDSLPSLTTETFPRLIHIHSSLSHVPHVSYPPLNQRVPENMSFAHMHCMHSHDQHLLGMLHMPGANLSIGIRMTSKQMRPLPSEITFHQGVRAEGVTLFQQQRLK